MLVLPAHAKLPRPAILAHMMFKLACTGLLLFLATAICPQNPSQTASPTRPVNIKLAEPVNNENAIFDIRHNSCNLVTMTAELAAQYPETVFAADWAVGRMIDPSLQFVHIGSESSSSARNPSAKPDSSVDYWMNMLDNHKRLPNQASEEIDAIWRTIIGVEFLHWQMNWAERILINNQDDLLFEYRVRKAKMRCKAGRSDECTVAGRLLIHAAQFNTGGKSFNEPLLIESEFYFKKSCHLRNESGCKILFPLFSYYYKLHDASSTEATRFNYYSHECNVNNPVACGELGVLYTIGDAVPVSHLNAYKQHKKACSLGYAQSCSMICHSSYGFYKEFMNTNERISACRKACIKGDYKSCRLIGE